MITFDAINKRVILDTASVTATELYSRSCDWLALADNAKYGAVFRQVGGDDLGAGLSIPPYFFLQGAWRIRPMESNRARARYYHLRINRPDCRRDRRCHPRRCTDHADSQRHAQSTMPVTHRQRQRINPVGAGLNERMG